MQIIRERIDELLWQDRLTRYGAPGRVAAGVLRYVFAVGRDFFSGQLTLRAMSLVYTTLLSIVPLLAFSFALLKGFGVHQQYESQLRTLLEPLGDASSVIIEYLLGMVENVNGSVLGGIGLAFFIYTAVSMVQKVEESFNYVWYVDKPRSFARRFVEYLFVLSVGPVAVFIALGMLTSLQSEAAVQYLLNNDVIGPLFHVTSRLTPYLMIIGVFTFMYWFVPNTQVTFRAAAVGGIAGGFLWATISLVFAAFIANSVRTEAVYAGFAIAIVTLIWLYLNWLILLIGSQLAFYIQNPAYLRQGRRDPRLSNAMRERLALNIMFLIGRVFREDGKSIDIAGLSDALKIPSLTIAPVLAGLEQGRLVTLTEDELLQPGRDLARITLREILDTVRAHGETGAVRKPRWAREIEAIGGELDTAIAGAIGDRTLADLLDADKSA